jgi:hypothetical protein
MEKIEIEIQYHEGGDSYRPFIILPATQPWVTENQAYFMSSGRSNTTDPVDARKNEYKKNTFFPTAGLLREGTVLFDELKKQDTNNVFTDGYILKGDYVLKLAEIIPKTVSQIFKWRNSCSQQLTFQPKYDYYGQISEYVRKVSMEKDHDILKKYIDEIQFVCDYVCLDYFTHWWQIQHSARIGGGLWDKLPFFREFVLNHDFNDYKKNIDTEFKLRETPLQPFTIHHKTPIQTADATQIQKYLQKNRADATQPFGDSIKEWSKHMYETYILGNVFPYAPTKYSPSPDMTVKPIAAKTIKTRKRVTNNRSRKTGTNKTRIVKTRSSIRKYKRK